MAKKSKEQYPTVRDYLKKDPQGLVDHYISSPHNLEVSSAFLKRITSVDIAENGPRLW